MNVYSTAVQDQLIKSLVSVYNTICEDACDYHYEYFTTHVDSLTDIHENMLDAMAYDDMIDSVNKILSTIGVTITEEVWDKTLSYADEFTSLNVFSGVYVPNTKNTLLTWYFNEDYTTLEFDIPNWVLQHKGFYYLVDGAGLTVGLDVGVQLVLDPVALVQSIAERL